MLPGTLPLQMRAELARHMLRSCLPCESTAARSLLILGCHTLLVSSSGQSGALLVRPLQSMPHRAAPAASALAHSSSTLATTLAHPWGSQGCHGAAGRRRKGRAGAPPAGPPPPAPTACLLSGHTSTAQPSPATHLPATVPPRRAHLASPPRTLCYTHPGAARAHLAARAALPGRVLWAGAA